MWLTNLFLCLQLSGASSTAADAVDSQIADQEDQDNSSDQDEEDDDGRESSPALSQFPSTQAARGVPPSRSLTAATNRQNRVPTPSTPPVPSDAPEKCCFTPCVGDDEIHDRTSGCQPPMKVHSVCMRLSPLMEYGKPSKKVGNKKPKEFYFAENVVYCGKCLPRLFVRGLALPTARPMSMLIGLVSRGSKFCFKSYRALYLEGLSVYSHV